MFDVVEAKLMGVNLMKRRRQYDGSQRKQIDNLQNRLNVLLKQSKNWAIEKEAKVWQFFELSVKVIDIFRIA